MATKSNKPQQTETSQSRASIESKTATRGVAVGSSAGGLDALTELLAGLPTDLAVAYVVAQHMSPDHRVVDRERVCDAPGGNPRALRGRAARPDLHAIPPLERECHHALPLRAHASVLDAEECAA